MNLAMTKRDRTYRSGWTLALIAGAACLAGMGGLRAGDEPVSETPPDFAPVAGPSWKRLKPEQVISDKAVLYLTSSNYQKAKSARVPSPLI